MWRNCNPLNPPINDQSSEDENNYESPLENEPNEFHYAGGGTHSLANHETSNQESRALPSSANEEFQGVITGPPPAQAFNGRPVRSTRNPHPNYVDSFWLASAIGLNLR